MKEGDRLAMQITVGAAVLIGGAYALFLIFGESALVSMVAITGWFVLLAYILKYHRVFKKGK